MTKYAVTWKEEIPGWLAVFNQHPRVAGSPRSLHVHESVVTCRSSSSCFPVCDSRSVYASTHTHSRQAVSCRRVGGRYSRSQETAYHGNNRHQTTTTQNQTRFLVENSSFCYYPRKPCPFQRSSTIRRFTFCPVPVNIILFHIYRNLYWTSSSEQWRI